MALADDLKTALSDLQTSVNAAVALLHNPPSGGSVPDSDVAAAIAAIAADKSALDAAVTAGTTPTP